MTRRCAWCDCFLGYAGSVDTRVTTHGICTSCAEQMLLELNVSLGGVDWQAPNAGEPVGMVAALARA